MNFVEANTKNLSVDMRPASFERITLFDQRVLIRMEVQHFQQLTHDGIHVGDVVLAEMNLGAQGYRQSRDVDVPSSLASSDLEGAVPTE